MAKLKGLRYTISGSFRDGKKEYIDFENVTGVIPFNEDEDWSNACVRKRYALMWIMEDKNFPKRPHSVREVHFDKVEKVEAHEFSFVGKDIKEMTYGELQDLATLKGLREIPLYKKSSLRATREKAYLQFSQRCLGFKIDEKSASYNYSNLPALLVDEQPDMTVKIPMTNEELLDAAAETRPIGDKSEASALPSRALLEKAAHDRDIKFHPNISDEKLYDKIYN